MTSDAVMSAQPPAQRSDLPGAVAANPSPPTPAIRSTPGRRRWGRRRFGILLLLLAVAGVIIAGWVWRRRSAAAIPVIDPSDIASVTRADVEKSIQSSGTVAANLSVDIKCRASGEVTQLPFDISQTVKQGDLLCQLDPTDENLAVRSAQASVAQTTAKLAQAKATLAEAELNLVTTRRKDEAALASAKVKAANLRAKASRQEQLVAQKLGDQEDLETAETDAATAEADQASAEVAVEELKQQEIELENKRQDVKTAEAQADADQINLDTQKQQLAYTTVSSPIAGTVSALDVQLGTIVASGTGGYSGGTTIMTLADLSRIFVTATVDESDIGGVRVGQPARIMVDSFPGRNFDGKVVRIAVAGTSTSNVVTFEVKVEVLDPHKDLLKPQMTGTVTIVEETRKNVLTVPAAAVSHEAGKTFVTTVHNVHEPITLGLEGSDSVEVLSGVKEGEQLLLGGIATPTVWKNGGGGPPQ